MLTAWYFLITSDFQPIAERAFAVKLPPEFFRGFDAVIGDEAHTFKAKSLTALLEMMPHVRFRHGMTGSLDGSVVNALTSLGNRRRIPFATVSDGKRRLPITSRARRARSVNSGRIMYAMTVRPR